VSAVIDIRDALVTLFSGVSGLAYVLETEPKSIQQTPMMYVIWTDAEYQQTGQLRPVIYFYLCRLVVAAQNISAAYDLITPYVDSIPAAVWSDQTLGGVVSSGIARITDSSLITFDAGGTRYLAIDFTARVTYKGT
jgi:hypothetical protein